MTVEKEIYIFFLCNALLSKSVAWHQKKPYLKKKIFKATQHISFPALIEEGHTKECT